MTIGQFFMVSSIFFIMGIFTYHMIVVWNKTYSKEVKEEKQQAELEAIIMDDYRPKHRDDETYISTPRFASSKSWKH